MGAIGWFVLVIVICSIGIFLKMKSKISETELEKLEKSILGKPIKKENVGIVSENQNPSIKINRPADIVWEYFTTFSNWSKWYGGGVKTVTPGWEVGAKIFWELGGSSPITTLIPKKEICISGAFMDTTYKFIPDGNAATIIEVTESKPKGGAYFRDGGASHKSQVKNSLQNLKKLVEHENVQAVPKNHEHDTENWTRTLVKLYDQSSRGGFSRWSEDEPEARDSVRKIGEEIAEEGGFDLMLHVHSMFAQQRPAFARNLEMMWSGIGEWQG